MAQLTGSIQFTGSLGNLRSYYDRRLKRYILTTKGGANKELIMNNPAFARTRENMNEFKACGQWASQLRRSLLSIAHLHEGNYFSEIVALGKSIQKYDEEHLRGFRSIESSKAAGLLQGINFNRRYTFDRVLASAYEVGFSQDRTTVTLKLPEFKSYTRLKWPTRYQTYRFALVIAQLPDYVWSEEAKSYQPVVRDLEQRSVSVYSEWRNCDTDQEDLVLAASFAEPALQQRGTIVVVAVGIEVTAFPSPPDTVGFGTMKIVESFAG